MNVRRYLGSKRLLFAVWALLVIWAVGLAFWWTQLDQAAWPQIAQAQPTPISTAARPGAPATLPPGVTPTSTPHPTPVLRPVERVPGPLVRSRDFLALSRAFGEELAFEHILTLTNHQMAGRKPGYPSNTAPDYIAQEFAEYGLQPAGEDGTYFQPFPMPYLDLVELPSLAVIGSDGQVKNDYRFRDDFNDRSRYYSGAGQAEGQVLWVNYGAYHDYDEADAVGKIVLIRHGAQDDIYRNAVEHGAAGLLIITEDPNWLGMRFTYKPGWIPQTIPVFLISHAVAEDLLVGSGYTLDDLSITYRPVLLPSQVRMSVSLSPEREGSARNTLGVLPGSDPAVRDEIVVIGAHSDHLGADPCPGERVASLAPSAVCDVWAGANDDASGVAVLLDIARLWQEQGYVPRRSVLFAAWDAEEAGLLGSTYYVEHPSFPITRTVGMIQLDMVGAGPNLFVDGPGHLAEQVSIAASQIGVTTTLQASGRSDHTPFIEAHVPAVMLIWSSDPLVPTYHQVSDVPETIEPDVLERTGMVTNLSLLALSWDEPALHELVAERARALRDGDRAAFAATDDPDDEALRITDGAWFNALRAAPPAELDLTLTDLLIASDVATGTLKLRLRETAEESPESITYKARFMRRDGEWRYAGPAFRTLSTQHFTVSYLSGKERDARALAEGTLDDDYQAIVALLGGEPGLDNALQVYPSVKVMWGGRPPSPAAAYDAPSARMARIVAGTRPAVALFELALRQRGVPAAAVPWLAEGLASVWEGQRSLDDAVRVQSNLSPLVREALGDGDLTPADAFPPLSTLEGDVLFQRRGQAWAMAQYLVDAYGWERVRQLVDALAAGQGLAEALRSIGTSLPSLDLAWRKHFQAGWLDTEVGIRELLTTRSRAVADGDLDAFLATEDPTDPALIAAARRWFADLTVHPLQTYNAGAELLARTADGAIVEVALDLQPADSSRVSRATYQAAFKHRDGAWRHAGPVWVETTGQHIVLRAQPGSAFGGSDLEATEFVTTTEQVYAQVTADLGLTTALPVVVELYDDASLFRALAPASLPTDAAGWTAPGAAIRLLARQATPGVLAAQLMRQLLAQAGLDGSQASVRWLVEGLAALESQRADPSPFYGLATRYLEELRYAARADKLASLGDLPAPESLSGKDAVLAEAQAWGAVAFLVDEYGFPALRSLLLSLASSESMDAALKRATGLGEAAFQEAWVAAAGRGLVPEPLIKTAQAVDPERALRTVAVLTADEYRGRPSGSPEADAVATFLADELAALGLTPAGEDGTFFQTVPLSVTTLTDTPTLAILDQGGGVQRRFTYRQDFVERVRGAAAGGAVEGPVVWVRDLGFTDMQLDGKIVLVKVSSESLRGVVRQAAEHDAAGLLAYTDVRPRLLQAKTSPLRATALSPAPEGIPTLPVLELAEEAFLATLDAGGYTLAGVSASPPALALGVRVRLEVPLTPVATAVARNVVGLWPAGSQGSEVAPLVLAAGYDGPGDLPDGTAYRGANQAAGAATLLEIARTWRDQGFRPARPVLFVFAGAELAGDVGMRAFLARPTMPFTGMVWILQAGGIGTGDGFYLIGEGRRDRDAALVHQLTNSAAVLGRRFSFESANVSAREGLPWVWLHWDGSQALVGYPEDNADALDQRKLRSAGETIALAAMMLSRNGGIRQ